MGPTPTPRRDGRRSRRAVTLLLSAVTSLALLTGLAPLNAATATAADTIDVYVTFEGHTLGQGYYVEPVKMTVTAGRTAAQVTAALLADTRHDVAPDPGDPTSSGWYLHGVAGMDTGTVKVPSYITSQPGFTLEPTDRDRYLATPDYNPMSGWMYTVNNVMAPVGAGQYALADGDVMRWQFTLFGYGCDLGVPSGCWGQDPYVEMVDRSALIRAIAAPDATTATAAEIARAKEIAIDPTATSAAISAALSALQTVEQWTTVTTTATGQFASALASALVSQHGQTAGAPVYSDVKRLRIEGPMGTADWTALRNAVTVGKQVRELDLSAMASTTVGSQRSPTSTPAPCATTSPD